MPYTNVGKNAMLNYLATVAGYVSLHDGDPGETGANEISGGSPAYSRAAVVWSTASDGSMSAASAPLFNVPAGTTIRYAGYRAAVSGTVFYGYVAVPDRAFATQGLYRLSSQIMDLLSGVSDILVSVGTAHAVPATVDPTVILDSMEVTLGAVYCVSATVDPSVSTLGGVVITPVAVWGLVSTSGVSVVLGVVSVTPEAGFVLSVTVDPTVVFGSTTATPDVAYTVSASVDPTVTIEDPVGAVAVSDDFNRADGGLGADWETITSLNAPLIDTNKVKRNTAGGRCGARWVSDTFNADQFAEIAYSGQADFGAPGTGPAVRLSDSANTYYAFSLQSADDGGGYALHYVRLLKMVDGTQTAIGNLYALNYDPYPAIMRIEVSGTSVIGKIGSAHGSLSQVCSATDADIASGSAGFIVEEAAARVDDWYGGDL